MSAESVLQLTGNVAAFCGRCKRDVIVREDSLRCPYGDHNVEPTSLPRASRVAPAEPPTPTQQSVSLPKIKQAAAWNRATTDLLAALEKEEAEAVAAFEVVRERARAARRAVGAVRQILGLVKLDGAPAVATTPRSAHPLAAGQWSRQHERCINCGTTESAHASRGRCSGCDSYFRKHGRDREVVRTEALEPTS